MFSCGSNFYVLGIPENQIHMSILPLNIIFENKNGKTSKFIATNHVALTPRMMKKLGRDTYVYSSVTVKLVTCRSVCIHTHTHTNIHSFILTTMLL